jgi:prefoldin subunit 5
MFSKRKSPIENELASLRLEVAALRAQVATLREIRAQVATLREEVSDLRASAEWWRTLYEAAIRRGSERERD